MSKRSFKNALNRKRNRKADYRSIGFETLESRKLMTATGLETWDVSASGLDSLVQEINQEANQEVTQEAIQRIVNGEQTSEYPAVGYVGPLGCTGTLISPTHVLTAAHCLEGVADNAASFQVEGQTYSSSKVTIHQGYNPNDFGAGNDIAIIELSQPVNGIEPMSIFRGIPQVGTMLTLVGFGEGGTSQGGFDPNDTGKQVGQTELEVVNDHHIAWNFDSHNEANTAPGDSGGPAFIMSNGQQLIAGVTSGGSGDPHTLGDYSFDTRVDVHADWIDSIVGSDPGDPGDPGDSSDDHANEPGSSATLIRIDDNSGSDQGVLEQAGDRDAFMFVVTEAGETTISLNETDGKLDTYVRLYDADGNLIAENDDSGGTLNSELVEQLQEGTYYVTAGSYADEGTGEYQLDIQHQPDDSSDGGGYHSYTNNTFKEISEDGPNRVSTSINVDGIQGTIADVNVQVDIDHTWVGDLRLVLISPDGTRIQLANRVGGSGDDYSGTIFDQQAATSIRDADAPFEGTFQSQKSLALLNGQDPNGQWRLLVIDFVDFDGGSLNSWSLEFTTDSSRNQKGLGLTGAEQQIRDWAPASTSAEVGHSEMESLDAFHAHQVLSGQGELGDGATTNAEPGFFDGGQSAAPISAIMLDFFAASGLDW